MASPLILALFAQVGYVTVNLSGDITSIRLIENPKPTYPEKALKGYREGRTELAVVLGNNGKLSSIRVKSSSGFVEMDDECMYALKRWRFEKDWGGYDGKVVFNFQLTRPSLGGGPSLLTGGGGLGAGPKLEQLSPGGNLGGGASLVTGLTGPSLDLSGPTLTAPKLSGGGLSPLDGGGLGAGPSLAGLEGGLGKGGGLLPSSLLGSGPSLSLSTGSKPKVDFKLGGALAKRKLVSEVEMSYPEEPLKKGQGGTMVLDVVVYKSGKVKSVKVKSSSGATSLDSHGAASVKGWKFSKGSKTVKGTVSLTYSPGKRKGGGLGAAPALSLTGLSGPSLGDGGLLGGGAGFGPPKTLLGGAPSLDLSRGSSEGAGAGVVKMKARMPKGWKVMKSSTPVYPASAIAQGRNGAVVIEIGVSAGGNVKSVSIEKSSGTEAIDAAAAQAATRWRFGTDGKPGVVAATFSFVME